MVTLLEMLAAMRRGRFLGSNGAKWVYYLELPAAMRSSMDSKWGQVGPIGVDDEQAVIHQQLVSLLRCMQARVR